MAYMAENLQIKQMVIVFFCLPRAIATTTPARSTTLAHTATIGAVRSTTVTTRTTCTSSAAARTGSTGATSRAALLFVRSQKINSNLFINLIIYLFKIFLIPRKWSKFFGKMALSKNLLAPAA